MSEPLKLISAVLGALLGLIAVLEFVINPKIAAVNARIDLMKLEQVKVRTVDRAFCQKAVRDIHKLERKVHGETPLPDKVCDAYE